MTAPAVEQRGPEEIHAALMAECAPCSPELAARLKAVPKLLDADPAEALSAAGLGEAWIAEEATACIAGGISGARNGVDGLPAAWRQQVENADQLSAVTKRLSRVAGSSQR